MEQTGDMDISGTFYRKTDSSCGYELDRALTIFILNWELFCQLLAINKTVILKTGPTFDSCFLLILQFSIDFFGQSMPISVTK